MQALSPDKVVNLLIYFLLRITSTTGKLRGISIQQTNTKCYLTPARINIYKTNRLSHCINHPIKKGINLSLFPLKIERIKSRYDSTQAKPSLLHWPSAVRFPFNAAASNFVQRFLGNLTINGHIGAVIGHLDFTHLRAFDTVFARQRA